MSWEGKSESHEGFQLLLAYSKVLVYLGRFIRHFKPYLVSFLGSSLRLDLANRHGFDQSL